MKRKIMFLAVFFFLAFLGTTLSHAFAEENQTVNDTVNDSGLPIPDRSFSFMLGDWIMGLLRGLTDFLNGVDPKVLVGFVVASFVLILFSVLVGKLSGMLGILKWVFAVVLVAIFAIIMLNFESILNFFVGGS